MNGRFQARHLIAFLMLGLALCTVGRLNLTAGSDPKPASSPAGAALDPLRALEARAKSGDAESQAKLGDYYYTQADYTNAVQWYRRSAAAGHSGAQISLAECYAQGRGVPRNAAMARQWSHRSMVQISPSNAVSNIPNLPPAQTGLPAAGPSRIPRITRLQAVQPVLEDPKATPDSYLPKP